MKKQLGIERFKQLTEAERLFVVKNYERCLSLKISMGALVLIDAKMIQCVLSHCVAVGHTQRAVTANGILRKFRWKQMHHLDYKYYMWPVK